MGERETVTAGAWYVDDSGDSVRCSVRGPELMACVWVASHHGWSVWFGEDADADGVEGPETGQAGRDAADAALRAAGVVLL